jgi:hypothetical protein
MLLILLLFVASTTAREMSVSEIRRHYFGNYAFIYEFFADLVTSNDMSGKYVHLKVRQTFNIDDYPFLDPRFNDNIKPGTEVFLTKWTDSFLYWLQNSDVVEGSFMAFFGDISLEKGVDTVCFTSF